MLWRFVIVDIGLGDPSPAGPGAGPDQGGEATPEQVLGLAQVDDVEDDSLVFVDILYGEIEPKSTEEPPLQKDL